MIDGRLFTRDFLLEGIRETESWLQLDPATVETFRLQAAAAVTALSLRKNPNEAQTEDDLVYPLLERLGWAERDVQPNASIKARLDGKQRQDARWMVKAEQCPRSSALGFP